MILRFLTGCGAQSLSHTIFCLPTGSRRVRRGGSGLLTSPFGVRSTRDPPITCCGGGVETAKSGQIAREERAPPGLLFLPLVSSVAEACGAADSDETIYQ